MRTQSWPHENAPERSPRSSIQHFEKSVLIFDFGFLEGLACSGKTSGGIFCGGGVRLPTEDNAAALRIGKRHGRIRVVRMAPELVARGRVEAAELKRELTLQAK